MRLLRARHLIALWPALLAAGSAFAQSKPVPPTNVTNPTVPALIGSAGQTGLVAPPPAATGPAGATGAAAVLGSTGATGQTGATGPARPAQPPPQVARVGRFDIDQPLAVLALLPELRQCAPLLTTPFGHAECALPTNDEKFAKLNLSWDDARPGGDLLALRLTFDPQLAPSMTDLEAVLARGWGQPVLEQLRRDHENKIFTLQWEDGEHRATLEAAGLMAQPSRAIAILLERKPRALTGELATLRPRPFPNMRIRFARRLEYEGQTYAAVWGTSLTAAQEALGEASPAWPVQRSYVGLFKLEPPGPTPAKRRWKPIWERTSGDEEDNDLQRITWVDTHDVTGDSDPDLLVELSCPSCGESTSEVLVKTVRAGKAVDLLDKHDLYRAQVDARPGQVRIREAEGDDAVTVSTYAYDKSKGAFVLAREEREGEHAHE